jgi:hypothetical protein
VGRARNDPDLGRAAEVLELFHTHLASGWLGVQGQIILGAMTRRRKVVPFPTTPSAVHPERGLAEVHRCTRAEAVVVQSLFESESIPTLLRSRLAHSVHPFTVGDQGEVVILVPEAAAPQARRLLARVGSGPRLS